ncbi:hypothetical protein [Falsiroseomonas selenitidurans]|uniref:Phycocyanobilin:ferredoxin oxidoreductase n=1 Tax=Falsiroseomonas selenitidurans TaxID=2716335 RepID=A0ABX1EFT6_9PROT|nr:hypothetical protein [Falsiroseomonas selenitidurans]NKC33760.1 hypothetical protein [Falsiroseomonas selenitidurans]
MTLIRRLDETAQALAEALPGAAGARILPVPDWLQRAGQEGTLRRPLAWRNTVLATATLRRLHVEYFAIPGEIAVLHVCAFPHLDRALPIFGFDVIAGRDRATGCFLDLSPSVPEAEAMVAAWGGRAAARLPSLGLQRSLPEWTAIFSPQAVAVRPADVAGFDAGLDFGRESLAMLLAAEAPRLQETTAMAAAQRRYVEAQRRNDRTRRMLAGCIGTALADAFIATCLFPLPPAMAEG